MVERVLVLLIGCALADLFPDKALENVYDLCISVCVLDVHKLLLDGGHIDVCLLCTSDAADEATIV
jgi:hypothetical protein